MPCLSLYSFQCKDFRLLKPYYTMGKGLLLGLNHARTGIKLSVWHLGIYQQTSVLGIKLTKCWFFFIFNPTLWWNCGSHYVTSFHTSQIFGVSTVMKILKNMNRFHFSNWLGDAIQESFTFRHSRHLITPNIANYFWKKSLTETESHRITGIFRPLAVLKGN